jgi:hypothetical protein
MLAHVVLYITTTLYHTQAFFRKKLLLLRPRLFARVYV